MKIRGEERDGLIFVRGESDAEQLARIEAEQLADLQRGDMRPLQGLAMAAITSKKLVALSGRTLLILCDRGRWALGTQIALWIAYFFLGLAVGVGAWGLR